MSEEGDSDSGWIYCFENPCMPGIYKIGLTTRTPEERLANANATDTWKPPMPYQIVMTQRVHRVRDIERTLHSLLEEMGTRVHPRREFFRVSRTIVEKIFTLMGASAPVETALDGSTGGDTVEESMTSTISCICCDWSGLSHRFPRHALQYHSSSIILSSQQIEHCVVCYLQSGEHRLQFTACLACHKGTISSPYRGNGARWVTRHAASEVCLPIHKQKLEISNFPTVTDDT